MIQFNKLKVSQDGKNLIIDAQVENCSYYTNIHIDSIIIDTQHTFVTSGPSVTPAFKYTYTSTSASTLGYDTILDQNGGLKEIRMTISHSELGETTTLDQDLLFVYVIINGSPSPNTPCGMDNTYELGVIYNDYPHYLISMNYINELSSCCKIPQSFIDYFLEKKAFELAIKVGSYLTAINYWNKFFTVVPNTITYKTCQCNE